jgi:hypothetical protein
MKWGDLALWTLAAAAVAVSLWFVLLGAGCHVYDAPEPVCVCDGGAE